MPLIRPHVMQLAATRHLVPGAPLMQDAVVPAPPAARAGALASFFRQLMNAPSFIRKLVRSVVRPANERRAGKRAQQAIELCHALISERGEVSLAVLARDALDAYNDLTAAGRSAFFDRLVAEFAPDRAKLDAAYDAYRAEPTQDNLIELQRCVEAPRQELFRRLNTAPGGTAALVAMRREVLGALARHPQWRGIESDLEHLFGSWFNRGFLTLERIDWYTPAIVLEKLIEYEAVHAIDGWHDLRRRLAADRRCFAFFHPALPHEPLIFIEVALTRGMSASIDPLLALEAPQLDPHTADTAIFYSITNCQTGLRGISFGNLLIKQVAQRLGQEFPRIKTFATLSPIPGFRTWLERARAEPAPDGTGAEQLEALGLLDKAHWHKDAQTAERLRAALMPCAAYYLACAKQDHEAADAVARFHLGNGARLERLNWLADTSKRGLQQSAGMMVNYLYRLDEVEENHEMYVREQKVAASRDIRRLATECPLPTRS
ncbi:MAG TPA: malonyl-CoA decarboxylase [Burkholderiales bacterium]|nr:malonyl-CoA decarboxylase [Burkholderiales bacterium]